MLVSALLGHVLAYSSSTIAKGDAVFISQLNLETGKDHFIGVQVTPQEFKYAQTKAKKGQEFRKKQGMEDKYGVNDIHQTFWSK